MFKNFFNKLNSRKLSEMPVPEVLTSTTSYDELYSAISGAREAATLNKECILDEKLESGVKTIFIPVGVKITEMDHALHLEGSPKDLQGIADEIQSMEFLSPGDHYMLGEWRFLVTDGTVMSSWEEKYIALPPDEWLMMGCKFNDAISGYDANPYTFFNSPFGSYTLPYGIEILVTDLFNEYEEED
jgi:hypothetical protein